MENFYAFYNPTTGHIVQRTTVHRDLDDRKLAPDEEHMRVQPRPYDEVASEQAAAMGLKAVKSDMSLPIQGTYIDVETGEHKSKGEQPSQYHTWNDHTNKWVFNANAVNDVWQRIASERDRRSLEGGVKVGSTWFHTDVLSRSKYVNIMLSDNLFSADWKAMGGISVQMGAAEARGVLQAIGDNDSAIFEAAQAHRKALEASEDPARYDWYGGWPPTYQEATA